MEVNERIIKLSGNANIPKELEMCKEYGLLIDNAEIRKIEDIPTDSGTINRIFNIKISELSEVKIIDGKEIIKTKTKGSPSQRFRNTLRYIMQSEDFERDYEVLMKNLIKNAEEINEKYGKTKD